ncbi:MAG: hypothetical protein IK990_07790, partial [Ruminiclostridium sp.]|nr:hypothetical protein [Ruminiclostridium sp.]
MNGAENATNAAAGAVSDYNEELESTGKTINRLAGFDTITKLSGGSSDGALVKSLLGDSGLEELQEAVNAASDISDIPDVAPSVDFSNLDFEEMTRKVLDSIANVNWNKAFSTIGDGLKFALKIGYNGAIGILHGFKDWSDTQDWEMNFLTIGNGLGDVLGAALDVFDSIFHTHIGEWYEDLRQTAARFGRDLEQAVNPDDEGLQALEKYEKEHGSYASNDFLKLYNQGMDPEDAFNRIYNTEDLRKGFFATDYKDALNGVSEWNDLSRQDLINHLDQQYYMLDRIHEGVETVLTGTTWDKLEYIFTPMGAGAQTHNAYNDIYNYEIPSSPSSNRSDVPLRSNNWISGGTPEMNISLTAIIDGVEHDGRIDNYKKE